MSSVGQVKAGRHSGSLRSVVAEQEAGAAGGSGGRGVRRPMSEHALQSWVTVGEPLLSGGLPVGETELEGGEASALQPSVALSPRLSLLLGCPGL